MMSEISYLTCSRKGCGYSPFPVDKGFENRARRTHETFYCPSGHAQYFAGESDLEKLKRKVAEVTSSRDYWKARFQRESKTCWWNGCPSYGTAFSSAGGFASHMRQVHGMPSLASLEMERVSE